MDFKKFHNFWLFNISIEFLVSILLNGMPHQAMIDQVLLQCGIDSHFEMTFEKFKMVL